MREQLRGCMLLSYSGSIDLEKEPAIVELLPQRAIGIGAILTVVDVVKRRRDVFIRIVTLYQ